MAYKDLGKRALVACIGGPLVLAAGWFGGYFFFMVVLVIALASGLEFMRLLKKKGGTAPRLWTLLGILAICTLVFAGQYSWVDLTIFGFLFGSMAIELARRENNALLNISAAVLTLCYVGVLFSFMLALRELPLGYDKPYGFGGEWMVLVFVAIWVCDSAAYFVGSRLGKHKLAAKISPNKTVEGAVGGVIGSLLVVWLGQLIFAKSLSAADVLPIGLIVGVFGQLSDLVESMFKRSAGIKDTSSILPGHGGILDRFDSEMLAIPVVYFYIRTFVL